MAESVSKRESKPLKVVRVVSTLQMTSLLIFFRWHVSDKNYKESILANSLLYGYETATKESVDVEDLVDDFVTFFFGGQDSTMSLPTSALVLTLLHPHVLERYISF